MPAPPTEKVVFWRLQTQLRSSNFSVQLSTLRPSRTSGLALMISTRKGSSAFPTGQLSQRLAGSGARMTSLGLQTSQLGRVVNQRQTRPAEATRTASEWTQMVCGTRCTAQTTSKTTPAKSLLELKSSQSVRMVGQWQRTSASGWSLPLLITPLQVMRVRASRKMECLLLPSRRPSSPCSPP